MLPPRVGDNGVEPPLVDPRFTDYFGMKRDADTVPATHPDDIPVRKFGNHVCRSRVANDWRANERRFDGVTPDEGHHDGGLEGFHLSPERVSFDRYVQPTERLLTVDRSDYGCREQDQSRARAENRKSVGDRRNERVSKFKNARQLINHTGFPAGDNQTVDAVKVTGASNLPVRHSQRVKDLLVLAHVALQSEYAYRQGITSHARRVGEVREGRIR